jgi:N-acylglucosamine-6-phosphate 2-epimerase
VTELPIIGCNKIFFPNTDVCITPSIRSALALVRAGADIIALDCTTRRRPRQSAAQTIAAIHEAGALALADLSCIDDGMGAIRDGADLLATTLAPAFDPALISDLAELGRPVLAEGHVTSLERAKEAMAAGAWAVCVGSAITRPHWITEQFNKAIGG